MRASVTLWLGLPYQIDRVTIAVVHLFVYINHINTSDRVTLSKGSSYPIASGECQTKMLSQDDIYEYFKRNQEHQTDAQSEENVTKNEQ